MDKTDNKEEDFFNVICGDLGLGMMSRSSHYLKFNRNDLNDIALSASEKNSRTHCTYFSSENKSHEPGTDGSHKQVSQKIVEQHIAYTDSDSSVDLEIYPTFADVPYATSSRQQKKLFQEQIHNLKKQFKLNVSEDKQKLLENTDDKICILNTPDIKKRLLKALQEMDELKIELDACRKRLDAKYKAVAILKQQAELADTELKKTEKKANETSRKLEQHGDGMNALVQALDDKEVAGLSKEMSELEHGRACQENGILMSKLEARNEELRRANAQKLALARERDELLALLDVTEREKYHYGKSRIDEEDYGTFSSSELAVLGACKCRVTSPDPCGCAHAAANLRKEVSKLKDELKCSQQRREEAHLTIEAYRSAFEEQLARSRNLSIRLSQLATISSRATKAKAALQWLIQVLNDDEYSPPKPIEMAVEADKGLSLSSMSLQELVTLLTDMVLEKNEIIAHNKLASQILANKLSKYEQNETEVGADSRVNNKEEKSKQLKTQTDKLNMNLKQTNEAYLVGGDFTVDSNFQEKLNVTSQGNNQSLKDDSSTLPDNITINKSLTFEINDRTSSIENKSEMPHFAQNCESKVENNDDFNNNDAEQRSDQAYCQPRATKSGDNLEDIDEIKKHSNVE